MTNFSVIRTYDRILQSYRKLQISVKDLIKASGAKHQEIWTRLGFKKDTFYRRLRFQDWSSNELQVMIPFLIKKVKVNDPNLYEQITDDLPDGNILPLK